MHVDTIFGGMGLLGHNPIISQGRTVLKLTEGLEQYLPVDQRKVCKRRYWQGNLFQQPFNLMINHPLTYFSQ